MERKKFILPTALILSFLFVNEVGVANAAYVFDNNAAVTEITGGLSGGGAGFGETFQTQVSNLSEQRLAGVGENYRGDYDGGGRLHGLFRNK